MRWSDSKFEVSGWKCDLRSDQQREKREERSERREERLFGPRMAGWHRKGSTPMREEGGEKRERREKREERDQHDQDERV